MIKILKKSLAIALFAGALSLFAASAAHAQAAGCNTGAGGGPSFFQMQSNHADAMRVRSRGYSRGMIKRNDPTGGLTCLDQAMGITARLGGIFSDVMPTVTGIANTSVFTGGTGTGASIANNYVNNLLVNNLNTMITPTLNQFLGNFGGGIGGLLGTTVGNFLNTIMGPINGALTGITTYVGSITGTVTTIMNTINQIQAIANQLGIALPQAVVLAITTALRGFQAAVNAAISTLTAAMSAAIKGILNAIMANLTASTNMQCDRVQNFWNSRGNTPAAPGGFRSIEGSGIQEGTPFFSTRQLLSGATGAANDMADELDNATNQTVLNAAMNDLTTNLNGPCTLRSWKTAPVIPANTTLGGVIALMGDPCP